MEATTSLYSVIQLCQVHQIFVSYLFYFKLRGQSLIGFLHT